MLGEATTEGDLAAIHLHEDRASPSPHGRDADEGPRPHPQPPQAEGGTPTAMDRHHPPHSPGGEGGEGRWKIKTHFQNETLPQGARSVKGCRRGPPQGTSAPPYRVLPPYPPPVPKSAIVLLLFSFVVVLTVGIVASLSQPPPTAVVVVVDPGHGGHDPGAVVAGVREKDVNLAIALRVQQKAASSSSLRVILTRSSDTYPTLLERLELADAVGARLYLSIHANYYRDPTVCGVETWVDTDAGGESLQLAREVQRAVAAATGAPDRGVHRQTLYLRHTSLPTALVEVGYLSCPAERAKLLDPAYQEKIADGILRGILAFLRIP